MKDLPIAIGMGNARVTFADLNGDAMVDETEILQTNHYYPFGMRHEGNTVPQQGIANAYQYNGKELNSDFGLDWLDYGASPDSYREYDASIARWSAVDPLAEKYSSSSTYHFAGNNPINNMEIDGKEFTARSWEFIHKIFIAMEEKINLKEKKIDELERKLEKETSEKKKEKLLNKINNQLDKLDELKQVFNDVQNEIYELSASDQVYDIYISDKYSESGSGEDRGGAGFNFSTGTFEIVIPKTGEVSLIAHELKHAYQFEKGAYSIGPDLIKIDKIHRNLLYDKYDEIEAYNRGAFFGGKTYTISNLPKVYDKVAKERVEASTHPTIKNVINTEKALQQIANASKHAFRVNGKTYYKKR